MDVFDIVTAGNATVDVFLQINETNKHFRLDPQTGELCIKSGDKAIIDKAYFMVGGNAANVSVGLSRMGFKGAIIAEIGFDEFADKIISTLKNEGVSESHLRQTSGASAFSVVINFKGERTIFQEDVEREHDFNFEGISAKWIYLTSLGKKWQNAYKKTLEFVINNDVKLAFNPGTLQIDAGEEHIDNILKYTEILFVNKEEAMKILRIEDKKNIEELLKALQSKGPKLVVITDGTHGSSIIDKTGNILFCESNGEDAVESTGAGDAYASGFMAALLLGLSYKDAMRWGSENALAVIKMIGAQPGLLRLEEMKKRLQND